MLTTTFSAPRSQADACLALTEAYPQLSLDVAEDPTGEDTYRYTFFLPDDLRDTLAAAIGSGQSLTFQPVDETVDYVALTAASFPPLTIGSFFIARNGEPTPPGLTGLSIMPNRAFGSGEHATTTGCLLAYTHLTQGHTYTKGLDFGAGSGILAIAAAKQHGTPFVCIDNDAPSVEINALNATTNGVETLLTCQHADTPPVGEQFNLIFANILLQPLIDLADKLTDALQPGGALILSGFTLDQSQQIAARYSGLGLRQTWAHEQHGWLAQIWQHASS
jgi:ribosomal protein L11 methyltransferase